MFPRRAAVCLIVCFVLAPPCAAKDPPAKDALPAGALFRLGRVNGDRDEEGHTGRVSAVAFSPDGKRVATGGWDRKVRLWDATGKLLQCLDGREYVFYVAFSPDGKTLASTSCDGTATLWDVAGGKELLQLTGHTDAVFGVAFAPDGKRLVTGGNDQTARLWEASTGRELRAFEGLNDKVTTVLFTPDGKAVAAACKNGLIATWDVSTGKERRRFAGHTGWVYPIALSPDGKTLASGGQDGTIRLWEVATGKPRRRPTRQRGEVYALAFAPDGKTLASACSGDNAVCLWGVADGKSRGKLEGHRKEVFRLDFSRDGKRLVSGSDDHTALVWDVARLAKESSDREPFRAAEADDLWGALAKADAEAAFAAVIRLKQAPPDEALALLSGRLKGKGLREAPGVDRLIADLDDDNFEVREKATAALEKAGPAAGPALRKALKGSPSAEVRRRLESIVAKLDADDWVSPDELRLLRAVEVLEGIGTPEARKLLEELAKSSAGTEAAEQAQASLDRLKAR